MITIKKIKLCDLEQFVKSDEFHSQEVVPISSNRAKSYINNPRANPDDIVMILAYESAILVGYRTLLSDFFIDNNEKVNFAWFSGVWVSENNRRQGVGTLLFKEAFKSWDGKLMYTNYAPNSKKLYDKTGEFERFSLKSGYRYYTRSCFTELLGHRLGLFKFLLPLLNVIDIVLNKLIDFSFYRQEKLTQSTSKIPEQIDLFIDHLSKVDSLYYRREVELNWIRNYPWISSLKDDEVESLKYYFSFYKKRWKQTFAAFGGTKNIPSVVYCLNLVNNHLKINYADTNGEGWDEMSKQITKYCISEKISYMDCYEEYLNRSFNTSKRNYFFRKKITQNYYCTSKILSNFPSIVNKKIYVGDGDSVFT